MRRHWRFRHGRGPPADARDRRNMMGQRRNIGHMATTPERRLVRSWKLAASLLGLLALVVGGLAVPALELDAPWSAVAYVAVVTVVLVAGTLWLVPRRSNASQ